MAELPSNDQVSAALRHVYTSAGTLLTVATVFAMVPQDQVQPILDALRETGDGLQKAFGGISKLVIIIGPLVGIWMGKIAYFRSGFGQQLLSVFKKASQPENLELKKEVIAATAELPKVAKIVAPDVAEQIVSDKVVTH